MSHLNIYVRNVVFATPEPPDELGAFYAHLLGWHVLRRDWFVIAETSESFPRLAFGDGPGEYRAPRWPDPEYPQQMHLDISVPEVGSAADLAVSLGASPLRLGETRSILADPAGHPFCLIPEPEGSESVAPRIARIVIDCFSPCAVATFYESLMGLRRIVDQPMLVISGSDDLSAPTVGFQHAVFPAARWPDPAFPQQMHLDLHAESGRAASELALSLGAIPLPAMGGSCPVFADPAAHPFCLCAPGE